MKNTSKRVFAKMLTAAMIAAVVLPLAACNTVEGLGRDARAAGDAITGAAKDNKSY